MAAVLVQRHFSAEQRHGGIVKSCGCAADHAKIAAAIGRQIGLRSSDIVLTGLELDRMDDPTLASVVPETDVFARTSPEYSRRLVTAFQSHGIALAMTDGGPTTHRRSNGPTRASPWA